MVFVAAALAAPAAASADADLSVTKTDSPDPVSQNANITYTITVTNNGPTAAQNVSLTDEIPAGTTFVSAAQNSGPAFVLATPPAGGNGTVTATAPTLANGASATFTLVVNVNEDTPPTTTIFNTATVASTTADPDEDDNSATAGTDVSPQADLGVVKTDDVDPVAPGQDIKYEITLSNSGPNAARDVVLSDAIPPGTTFVSATQKGGPAFTISTPAVGGTGNFQATAATLPRQEGATFELVVKVASGAANGSTVSNTANSSASTPDPEPANDSDTEVTTVNRVADLAVTKSDSPDPVLAGGDVTYTIEVTNSGPDEAGSVVLSDAVPAGTTFVSASQTSGPAFTLSSPPSGGGGTFTATRATLASGATARFTMIVRADPGAANGSTIENTASVDGATVDPDGSNDSASATTTVSKPAPAGQTVLTPFTPSAARSPRLTIGNARMRLPSGVLFVPLTCEYSPRDVCVSDVTVTFNTRKHKLDPLTVKNVHVGSGQSLDLYVAASRAQRRKMRRIGTIPVTVTATNAPEPDVVKGALLKGLRRR